MPFTFTHPLLILPFRKWARKRQLFVCFVIGCFVPDFVYFLPVYVGRDYAHSIEGMFTFCLPLSFLFYGWFKLFFAPACFVLLPRVAQEKLTFLLEPIPKPFFRSFFYLAIFSFLVGTFTHLLWDGWTSENGYAVLYFSSLKTIHLKCGLYQKPLFACMHRGFSLVGSLVMGTLLIIALRKQPRIKVKLPPEVEYSLVKKMFMLVCLFTLPIVAAAIHATLGDSKLWSLSTRGKYLYFSFMYSIQMGFCLWICFGIAIRKKIYSVGKLRIQLGSAAKPKTVENES